MSPKLSYCYINLYELNTTQDNYIRHILDNDLFLKLPIWSLSIITIINVKETFSQNWKQLGLERGRETKFNASHCLII